MKRHLPALSIALLAVVIGVGATMAGFACADNPVGRRCYIGPDAAVDNAAIIASPALECQSRVCLHLPKNAFDLCTGECSSSSDCDKVPESPCTGGFICMVPTTVGPFCCRKYCVCSDYLGSLPDGGIQEPAGCDPSNSDNECCNLSGRRTDPTRYPQCQ